MTNSLEERLKKIQRSLYVNQLDGIFITILIFTLSLILANPKGKEMFLLILGASLLFFIIAILKDKDKYNIKGRIGVISFLCLFGIFLFLAYGLESYLINITNYYWTPLIVGAASLIISFFLTKKIVSFLETKYKKYEK